MTTYKEIFGKPIKVLTGDPAPTPITYTVTVANPGSGNVYYIDGVQTPTLELYEGNTYNFDYSAATGHPFRFATAADAAGSTEYTTGVSVDSNITTIVVASGAPNLFYYCTNHNGMGGRALTPASPDEYTGQIWYNETTGKFRSLLASGTWSSATSLPATTTNAGGAGIQTAALFFGGRSGGAQRTQTLEYNGLGYSSGGAMGTARQQMGTAGTQTAALAATGAVEGPSSCPTESEEYNGTSWTAGGSVSTARFASGGAGTQTSAVIAGGRLGPGTWSAVTEEYGGTSWTSGGALNQTKTLNGAMTGSLTAAVAFGGDGNPPTAAVNDVTFYDGTSWTETGNLPAANRNAGSAGPQTASIMFGGMAPSETANAFRFDGTTFSATGSMGAATYIMAPAANASNNNTALSMGGYGGSAYLSRTEEYNFTANTITAAAAWSSGGNLNTARDEGASSQNGLQTAALYFGGYDGSNKNLTEQYDGTSWTAKNTLGTARFSGAGAGTTTAALYSGGYDGSITGKVEEFDGTNWAEQTDMSNARMNQGGCGIQTAALIYGGDEPADSNKTELYNGSSWTAGGTLSTARSHVAGGIGTSTAAICVGGLTPPNNYRNNTEEYGGSSWTTGGTLITGTTNQGGAGISTNAIVFGGTIAPGTPNYTAVTQGYDGTSWSTRPSLGTARNYISGTGTAAAGVAFGGNPSSSYTTATEEFTGETTSLNYKNISSS